MYASIRIPFYQHTLIRFQTQVAIFVAKLIGVTFLGGVGVGMVFGVEALVLQLLFGHYTLAFLGYQFLQYAAVFSQHGINASYLGRGIGVQLVVVVVAALVVAKLFVRAALDGFAAVEACFHLGDLLIA